jgi:hypothetical protein
MFFDESIDAKMNRYTFKMRSIDTPFLLDSANIHAKTYVPPTPNAAGLPLLPSGEPVDFTYETFPSRLE